MTLTAIWLVPLAALETAIAWWLFSTEPVMRELLRFFATVAQGHATATSPAPILSPLSSGGVVLVLLAVAVGVGLGVASLIPSGAAIFIVVERATGAGVDMASALRVGLRRFPKLLLLLLLQALPGITVYLVVVMVVAATAPWGLLLLLAVVPLAIWVLVKIAFATQAVVVEGIGPPSALVRSWRLVSGRWWRTLGVLAVFTMLVWLGTQAFGILGQLAAAGVAGRDPGISVGVLMVFSLAAQLLLGPVTITAAALLYLDLRARAGDESVEAGPAT